MGVMKVRSAHEVQSILSQKLRTWRDMIVAVLNKVPDVVGKATCCEQMLYYFFFCSTHVAYSSQLPSSFP
jgi:hypothetical protein